MRTLTITLILSFALFSLLSACSKEEAPPTTAPKPVAIQAAEKVAVVAEQNNGRRIYEESCAACHNTGVMHAPKLGDKAAWAGHIEHGLEHMTSNAISGIGKMPAKGGNMKLSDAEVRAAVEYMLGQSR